MGSTYSEGNKVALAHNAPAPPTNPSARICKHKGTQMHIGTYCALTSTMNATKFAKVVRMSAHLKAHASACMQQVQAQVLLL